jgi:hypothetical protein
MEANVMIRILPTRLHGMMDYVMGVLLIISPQLFGFVRGGAETWLPVALGAGMIGYSMLTNYELGVYRLIDMPVHLALDAAGGILLLASPWLFGFAGQVWVPHVILGLLEVGTAAMTEPRPAYNLGGGGRAGAI